MFKKYFIIEEYNKKFFHAATTTTKKINISGNNGKNEKAYHIIFVYTTKKL